MTGRDKPPADDASWPDDAGSEALRQQLDHVPPDVARRLADMRRGAVAELDAASPRPRRWFLAAPLAGAAAALVLVLALTLPTGKPADSAPLPVVDADELAALDDLELLEDLEFLAWLEQEELNAVQG